MKCRCTWEEVILSGLDYLEILIYINSKARKPNAIENLSIDSFDLELFSNMQNKVFL